MKWVIVLLMVAGAGGAVYYYQSAPARAAATQPAATTAPVSRGNIFQAVSTTGRLVSNLDVDIKCKASGQITELPFDISQQVTKDALLVQVDPVDEKRSVRQAEAGVAQSAAKLAQARQALVVAEASLGIARQKADTQLKSAKYAATEARSKAARRKELFEQKLVSPEEFQAAETQAVQADSLLDTARIAVDDLKTQELALETKRQDVKLSEAEVQSDEIVLENARQRLSDTKVVAPMNGVVAALNVQKGQIISSGITNVGGGTTIMTLSDLSRIFVLASMDESDIGKVGLGQRVLITADAQPGRRFRGEVVRIATRGVNVSNVVTFEVKIEITSENKSLLKPEMTANVQIVAAEKQDVLVVPAQAVTRREGKVYATVKEGEKTSEVAVQTGLSDGEKVEIVAGLNEGQTVAVRKEEQPSRWREGGGQRPGGGMGGGPLGGGMGGGRR